MKRSHLRRLTVPILVFVFASLGLASAQVDDRARALLEGLQPPAGETIETLDQVMTMTIYQGDDEPTEVRTRTVVDYAGERAAIETEVGPGMVATMVLADGQARMVMNGMSLPLPAAMSGSFEGIFDRAPEDLLAEGATATYDGVQAYGDLLEGEQVTVTGASLVAGVDGSDVSRYVFDDEGRLAGMVVDTDEGTLVTVFDEPFSGSPVVGRSATMYRLDGAGGAERFATMTFEDVRINEPIEDGTFD
jgi:hypothetical protein